ncbi:hypothetical protein Tco_0942071 [Tanacetum coccineum]
MTKDFLINDEGEEPRIIKATEDVLSVADKYRIWHFDIDIRTGRQLLCREACRVIAIWHSTYDQTEDYFVAWAKTLDFRGQVHANMAIRLQQTEDVLPLTGNANRHSS